MKKQTKLKITPTFPIITFWIKGSDDTQFCQNPKCSSKASFTAICYEDFKSAAALTHTAGLSKIDADKLLWQKSVRQQTQNQLMSFGSIFVCRRHLEMLLNELLGSQIAMLYLMPIAVMGAKIDAVVFRQLKDADIFNLVMLHQNFTKIRQVQQLLIDQTDIIPLDLNH